MAFKAETVREAQRVLTLQKELGFSLVLGELKEGWGLASKLKSSGAKVFLSLDLPEDKSKKKAKTDSAATDTAPQTRAEKEQEALEKRRQEAYARYVGQAAAFHKAGIPFGFSTLEVKGKDVKNNLRQMIAHGLSEDVALAALTTQPAQLLGLSRMMGTVEVGKMANLVVSDQPYFEEKSKVRYVFVDGKLFEYKDSRKRKVLVVGMW